MEKALIIEEVCKLLQAGNKAAAAAFATNNYPFEEHTLSKRKYNRYQMCRVFLRDGFIDCYSGERLVFPGLLMLLSLELPDIFRYHPNWKMAATHMVYWQLCPTIDHLVPVARNGADHESNLVTTSQLRNSIKSNWLLEECGWSLQSKGSLTDWDGLIYTFLKLLDVHPQYAVHDYIRKWKTALLKAMKELEIPVII